MTLSGVSYMVDAYVYLFMFYVNWQPNATLCLYLGLRLAITKVTRGGVLIY